MRSETYWGQALEKTRESIRNYSLYPLKTTVITRELYDRNDFIIRKL